MHVSMLRIPEARSRRRSATLIDCDVRFTTVHPDAIIG